MEVELRLTRVGYTRNRAWFADQSSLFRTIVFPAMIAVIRHPELGVVLFDTGYGRALEESVTPEARRYKRILPFELPERERVTERLRQAGVPVADLIFLSHFHPDHIGGLRELPGPPILCSRDGLLRLRSLTGLRKMRSAFFAELLPEDFPLRMQAIEALPRVQAPAPLPEGFDVAGDGSMIAVALPGHAAGQYGLLCRVRGGRRVLLCADAAWVKANFVRPVPPAWPVRALVDDYAAFQASLDGLHRLSQQSPEIRIIPSHCEESIAEYERQA